jgi:hypothetical protein
MKKLLFSLLVITIATTINAQSYIRASDHVNHLIPHAEPGDSATVVVPDEIINSDFSLEENIKAYQGDTLVVANFNSLKFKGFLSQEMLKENKLFFSQKEKKNVVREDSKPISEMKLSWRTIIVMFLYYLIFGYLVLKVKNSDIITKSFSILLLSSLFSFVVIVAIFFKIIAPHPTALVWVIWLVSMLISNNLTFDKKRLKVLFFVLSLLAMGIVSYILSTPLFITCCIAGLALALLIRSREVSLAKPETF